MIKGVKYGKVTVPIDGELVEIRVTNGPSSYGYIEDGMVHEFVSDADGNVVKERHTPLHVWNNLSNHHLPE